MQYFKKLSTLLITLLLAVGSVQAQDAYFSQFYANPIFLNPALAGSEGDARLVVAHRKQWTNLSSYTTSSFSYDMPIGTSSGIGFQAMNDIQLEGVMKQANAGITLSHRIILGRGQMIGLGLNANYLQKRFDWSNLVFEDQMRSGGNVMYPTEERFGQTNTSLFDLGIGATYSTDKILAGFQVAHINKPKEHFSQDSEAKLPIRYTLHLAYTIEQYLFSHKAYHIVPNVIFEKQGGSNYLNVGAYWSNGLLSAGAHYRVNQAMIFSAGFSFDQFGFGYSYDYFLANAETSFGNTNEFTLSYRFALKKKKKNVYVGKCPDIYKSLK